MGCIQTKKVASQKLLEDMPKKHGKHKKGKITEGERVRKSLVYQNLLLENQYQQEIFEEMKEKAKGRLPAYKRNHTISSFQPRRSSIFNSTANTSANNSEEDLSFQQKRYLSKQRSLQQKLNKKDNNRRKIQSLNLNKDNFLELYSLNTRKSNEPPLQEIQEQQSCQINKEDLIYDQDHPTANLFQSTNKNNNQESENEDEQNVHKDLDAEDQKSVQKSSDLAHVQYTKKPVVNQKKQCAVHLAPPRAFNFESIPTESTEIPNYRSNQSIAAPNNTIVANNLEKTYEK